MNALPLGDLFELRTRGPPTMQALAVPASALSVWAAELSSVEITLSIVIILTFCFSVCFTAYTLRIVATRRSAIYVEIGSPTEIVQIRLGEFPNATRYFGVKMTPNEVRVILRHYGPITSVTFRADDWYTWNFLDGHQMPLRKKVWVPIWTARRLARIISQVDHTVVPLIIHTHEYVFPKQDCILGRRVPPHLLAHDMPSHI